MNRSQKICESVDGLLLNPTLRDSFYKEKNRFTRQSTKPPLSHMTRVSRELVDAGGFDFSGNPWSLPTIGANAQPSYFDPNPIARWSPRFKRELLKTKPVTEAWHHKKGKKKGPPPSSQEQSDPEPQSQEKPGKQEQVQQQGQEQDLQQQQLMQQQQAQLQSQGLPQGQVSPQDMMQGGAMPPLPELPKDLRKDPSWEGNRSNRITDGLQTFSQKVSDRYNMTLDPLQQGGPRTDSYRASRLQTRWGDATTRPLRNDRQYTRGNK